MLGALRRCTISLPRTPPTRSIVSARSALKPSTSPASQVWRQTVARSVLAQRSFHQSTLWQQQPAQARAYEEAEIEQEVHARSPPSPAEVNQAAAKGPITKFSELESRELVHPNVVKSITQDMGFDDMTDVQSATINQALAGNDIIAQAKTGTGKTLGFLMPVLQRILKTDPNLARFQRGRTFPSDIRAIIISPTRELAEQIAVEAKKVCARTGLVVQTAVGGTQKRRHLMMIQRQGCHVLVGTPGRLNDIFSDPYSGVKAPKLAALVLDEADRLMDQGFWPEIEAIQQNLPDISQQPRQTLMFSATVPREVVQLVRQTLRPGFDFVRTVQENEEPTHHRVPQKLVHAGGLENLLPTLLELCKREVASAEAHKPFKALVYFNSTADVQLASNVFRNLRRNERNHPLYPARLFEISGRLTQEQRTRASDGFRKAHSGIMFSSDVTARGLDFPNVTHVIQVGLPTTRDTYIHRIGRTGRAGKEGEGWLIISDLESREARERLNDLPIKQDKSLVTAGVDASQADRIPSEAAEHHTDIKDAVSVVDPGDLVKGYMATLGTFQWYKNKQRLIESMNNLAKLGWGMEEPPSIPDGLAQKLGLNRLQGVRTRQSREFRDRGDSSSPFAGRSSSFGSSRGGSRTGDRSFGGRGGDRDSFGDKRSGGFGDRGDRRSGGFGDKRSSGFGDKRNSGFGDRKSGGFGDRRSGGSGDRGRGGFGDRGRERSFSY